MRNFSLVLKRAVKNKILQYIFSKYATFFIQFINSIFIAVYLGPFYLGIWGFINLILQYFSQINLGISHSVNVIISVKKDNEQYVQKVVGTAITMLLGLSFAVIILFIIKELFDFNLGDKYNFSNYALVVTIISIIGYFNTLFNYVFRVYGRTTEIAINQSVFPVLILVIIPFFRTENLLWALILVNLIAILISFSFFLYKSPLHIKPVWDKPLMKFIQKRGWHLFIYNTSFYLIIVSTKSFVSMYYKVEEFGFFTFAFSLANSVLSLLNAISYLIYPKILNRFAISNNNKNFLLLSKLRDTYVTSSHLFIHLSLLFFPVFLLFFPEYEKSAGAFGLIALTVGLYSNSFGYAGLLIAKGKEKKLSTYSFLALILNLILAYILITKLQLPFSQVVFATMLSYALYVFFLTWEGRKLIGVKTSLKNVIKDVYPTRLVLPFLTSVTLIILSVPSIYFILPIGIFVLMNYKSLVSIKKYILEILNNPKIMDI